MDIKPIKSEADYKRALRAIEELWEAKHHTFESDRLELLSILVEAFEREHYSIAPPDPIAGLARRIKAKILQASTSEVYGDPAVHPQREEYQGNVNCIGPRACYDDVAQKLSSWTITGNTG